MTKDHIPPQCCGNSGPLFVNPLIADPNFPLPAKARNGLIYWTLCERCNELLGRYDPALADFCDTVRAQNAAALLLQKPDILVPMRGAALRSIVGHFVAARLGEADPIVDPQLRAYVFGGAPMPANVNLFCWFHPHPEIVVARDFRFLDPNSVGTPEFRQLRGVGHVIKFPPVGFLLVDHPNKLALPELHDYFGIALDDTVRVPFSFARWFPPYWPERPFRLKHVVQALSEFFNAKSTAVGPFGRELLTRAERQFGSPNLGAVETFDLQMTSGRQEKSAWLIDQNQTP